MSIKQNGGVFGRNPTFNDVTIEGQLTFDGDIDINSDLKVNGDLEVTGDASIDDILLIGEDSGDAFNADSKLRLQRVGDRLFQQFKVDADQSAAIYFGDVDDDIECGILYDAATQSITLLSGNNGSALLLDSSQNVTVPTGNLVMGTSGTGIDFSATAGTGTSELLSDYEEGDWTPLIADASSGGNAGSGSVVGKYTKVGRQVTIIAVLNNIVTTGLTAGNDLFLLGIPFTPSNFSTLTKNTAPVSTSTVNNAASSYLTAILHDNTNYMRIQENITNATNDYILVSEITSGTSDLNFTLTYFTDS